MDPYLPSKETILNPPIKFKDRLKHLGPSLILSAAIVGSGELIATTTLGAKVGFTTFWLILLGCLIKVMVQVAFGKHTIMTGETAMQAFSSLPGPNGKRGNWAIWSLAIMMLLKLLQLGGIVGGVAIILNLAMPTISIPLWAFIVAFVVGFLVYQGYYKFIEKFSIFMIGFFTIFTFVALYFLKFTPYALEWGDILSGLQFQLPKASLAFAFGAFGITGVGGDEIIHYNYWCLEKGYAAYVGPKDNTPEWENRVKGWIKVMHLDAAIALIIYTSVTAAFYLLGASMLHSQGTVPEGYGMIETISTIYTDALGPKAKTFFLVGSFIVLFSTLFASLAAWTRQYADIFGEMGLLDFFNQKIRQKTIKILAFALPISWAILFVFIKLPVIMVMIGGIVGSLILLLIVFAVLYFRYRRTNTAFRPSTLYDFALWISAISIVSVGIYGLIKLL